MKNDRLLRLRKRHGWTRRQVATLADITEQTVYTLERDASNVPTLKVGRAIADALGSSVDQLWPPKEA